VDLEVEDHLTVSDGRLRFLQSCGAHICVHRVRIRSGVVRPEQLAVQDLRISHAHNAARVAGAPEDDLRFAAEHNLNRDHPLNSSVLPISVCLSGDGSQQGRRND
jgi:hypothetical protein